MSNFTYKQKLQRKAEINQQIVERWKEIEVQLARHPEWTVRNVTDFLGITDKNMKRC